MECYGTIRKQWYYSYLQKNHSPILGQWNEISAKNEQKRLTGSYQEKPSIEKFNECGRGNGLRYGVSCMQGWRGEMEDAHCSVITLGQERGVWRNISMVDWSFFGVFHGRSGDTVSNYCADQLLGSILYSPEFQEDIIKGIRAGFLRLDSRLRRLPEIATGNDKSSSSAVCALLSPFNIYIAHSGDSRAVLCSNGKPIFETKDHVPSNPKERARILKMGGTITITEGLSGLSKVSRGFGDFRYKRNEGKGPLDQIVCSDPEVHVQRRDKMDSFLILASNGIWDVMSSEEVCSYIDYLMYQTDDLEYIGNSLLNTCFNKGSKDSMNVIIMAFPGSPRVSDEALFNEKRIDLILENKIKGMMENESEYVSLLNVIGKLQESNAAIFPPGGGISAKIPFIELFYNNITPFEPEMAILHKCPSERPELNEVILY